jgi:hypothetical protein
VYVKIYITGFLDKDGQLFVKLSGICEDASIKISEDTIDSNTLDGVLKMMFARGCIPHNTPVKLIKTFTQFARICLLPLLMFKNGNPSES